MWFWSASFLLLEPWSFYYTAYIIFSILGVTISNFFFIFHILDISVRVRLLRYVLQSVSQNLKQLGATFFLGMLVVYLYTGTQKTIYLKAKVEILFKKVKLYFFFFSFLIFIFIFFFHSLFFLFLFFYFYSYFIFSDALFVLSRI